MWNHERQGLLVLLHLERRDGLQGQEGRFYREMGRIGVQSHKGGRTEISWWNYVEWNYDEILQKLRTAPRMRDCWCKRCKDKSPVPDWFVPFVHQFGGDRRWRVIHHI